MSFFQHIKKIRSKQLNMKRYRVCYNVAKLFFFIGTLFFLIQLIIGNITFITILGYYFVQLSILLNAIIVIVLVIGLIIEQNKKETLKSIGIIVANIPVALLYFYIVMEFLI